MTARWPAGGASGALLDAIDWRTHPLGMPESWSESLRAAVLLVLNAGQPLMLFWGPSLFCFCNDAYGQLVGQSRVAGINGRRAADIWGDQLAVTEPHLRRLLDGEETLWQRSQHAAITRGDETRDTWWTYSFSPVHDAVAPKGIGGVLALALETTQQVQEARAAADESRGLRELLNLAPSVAFLLRGEDLVFEFANEQTCRLFDGRRLVGLPLARAVPESEGSGFRALIDRTYLTGERAVAVRQPVGVRRRASGESQTCLFDLVCQPIRGAAGAVSGVFVQGIDVTAAVAAEGAADEARLLASERYAELDQVYATTPVGLALFDREFRFVRLNERLASINGRAIADHIGRSVFEVVAPAVVPALEQVWPRVLAGEEVRDLEVEAIDAPGGERAWLMSYSPMRDAGGAITHMLASIVDITERTQREKSLAASEQRLRGLTDAVPDVLFETDARGRSRWLSARWSEFTGQALSDAAADWPAVIHPDDLPATVSAWEQAIDSGRPFESRHRLRAAGHEWRWTITRGVPLRDTDGRVEGWVGSIADVHELVETQEALRLSEERLALALEGTRDGMWDWDIVSNAVYHSPGFAAQLGYTPDAWESTYANWIANMHADDVAPTEAELGRVVRGEIDTYAPTFRLRHRDGSWRWMLSRGRLYRDAQGRAVRMVGANTDITAQKHAEAALRELNATLEERVAEALAGRRMWAEVAETNDAFIQVLDSEYRCLAINRANADEYERIWGVRLKVGDTLADIFADRPETLEQVRTHWSRVLAGESFVHTDVFGDADGERRWYQMKFSPMRDAQGSVIGGCHISYDVTEQMMQQEELARMQAQLFETQKMDMIGRLTGGVAHDFNNLLAAVLGNLDLLRKRIEPLDERAHKLLDGAVRGAERGASLTQRLLAFARRQELKSATVDLRRLFADMADLLARSLGPSIRIAEDFPADLPPVTVDANQLELALLNLAVNARDAMPLGGTLNVSAQADTIGPGSPLGLAPGAYVRIEVADSGQGMDKETLRRATEPFFTTKGVGKGTGLGLPMVHGLAAQSGGALRIDSLPGRGTRVTLWFPQATEPSAPAPAEEEEAAPSAPSRPLTVLVVDDDLLVAMGTAAMLEDLGHTVIEASSGRKALDAFAARPDIDLVITDHAMPGMTGIELAARLRELAPDLPIVLATGYAELPNGDDPGLPRLAKPYVQSDLIRLLASLASEAKTGEDNGVPLRR